MTSSPFPSAIIEVAIDDKAASKSSPELELVRERASLSLTGACNNAARTIETRFPTLRYLTTSWQPVECPSKATSETPRCDAKHSSNLS
eukprot:CAMPEP_0115740646 /NCGR_PEP_ID=MMETSP0272-20121206/89588_1 /TAXON_ID=71861 /ORGANISM="Scrippsiella trochoidea, Strain CCMP3099" /LENGTH=88 /DNA_ID=CAMNT_0003185281 /DNA_START=274 /DNA_END=537 /DNA_ORIENTATION=+